MSKIKGFSLGGRLEWLVLILVLSGVLLFRDVARSQGIFRPSHGQCSRHANHNHSASQFLPAFADGPATSVVHVQPNFHMVTPGIWRSAKLNPESLKRMKTYGLKTIINLLSNDECEPWEDKVAKQMGIQVYHFPLLGSKVAPSKTVDAVLSILEDPARQPVLVHCAAGKDRSGMIIAAYRIAHTDWSFRNIFQEMMMYGYDTHLSAILQSLRLWSTSRGRLETAQQIALTEQKTAGEKK